MLGACIIVLKSETFLLQELGEMVKMSIFKLLPDLLFSVDGAPTGIKENRVYFSKRLIRVISYNLPTNYYLFVKGDDSSSFVLKQNFGSPFGNILAEKYTGKVILPEGSEHAKVDSYFLIIN